LACFINQAAYPVLNASTQIGRPKRERRELHGDFWRR
jgi:hypothetical protein